VYLNVGHTLATLPLALGWSQSDLDTLLKVKETNFNLEQAIKAQRGSGSNTSTVILTSG
jgi:hypothetical protein